MSFNPRDYTGILWKRKWVIAIVVIFALVGILYSQLSTPPLYESKSIIEIGHVYDPLDKDNKRVVDWLTTREIVTSEAFISEAIERLGWDYDPLSVKRMVNVENQEDNFITTIVVKTTSPQDAQKLSNVLAEQFVENYNEIYKSQVEPLEKDIQRIEEILQKEDVLIAKTEQTIEDTSEGKSSDQKIQELRISLLTNATAALYISRKDLLSEATELKINLAKSNGFRVLYPATLPDAPMRQNIFVLLAITLVASSVVGSVFAFGIDYWLSFPASGDKKGK